jgi:hypothetical protein
VANHAKPATDSGYHHPANLRRVAPNRDRAIGRSNSRIPRQRVRLTYPLEVAALVTVSDDEITIELSGSAGLPQLQRTVRVPLVAISSVTTEPPTNNSSLSSALASIAGPLTGARIGSVTHEGRHLLLAYTPGDTTLTLELDRKHFPEIDYDAIVLRAAPSSVSSLELDAPTAA